MSDDNNLQSFQNIFDEEIEQLKRRRIVAGIHHDQPGAGGEKNPDKNDPEKLSKDEERYIKDSLVGLAISGGGLRAATFSLGVVQSLRAHGLLRYFDYITSVSGGGYTAGYLATQITDKANDYEKINKYSENSSNENEQGNDQEQLEKEGEQPEKKVICYHDLDQFGVTEESAGTKSKKENPGAQTNNQSVEHERFDKWGWLNPKDYVVFRDCGQYLARPWQFSADYILSTLPMVLLFLCGIAAFTGYIAICYRSLDLNIVRDNIEIATRRTNEVFIAFLPTICISVIWMVLKLGLVSAGSDEKRSNLIKRVYILTFVFLINTAYFVLVNIPIEMRWSYENMKNSNYSFLLPSMETWYGSLIVFLALLGSLVSFIALTKILISKLFPEFNGARQWHICNGGVPIAAAFFAAGMFLLIFYCLPMENNFLFRIDALTGDPVIKEGSLFLCCAFSALLLFGLYWFYLGSEKFSDFLFRLVMWSVPLALVICITNGILSLGFLDDIIRTSGLPVMGQEGLKQPLTIYVFLAILALTQYRRLLKSQQAGATIYQRVALRLVLAGIVLGIPLLMFGSIAKENVSSYAMHRNPDFVESDLTMSALVEWWFESDQHEYSGQKIFGDNEVLNQIVVNYERDQRKYHTEIFGEPGWVENSRGWTTKKSGKIPRIGIALGMSRVHQDLRGKYLEYLEVLRERREVISNRISRLLNQTELTRQLGNVILSRVSDRKVEHKLETKRVSPIFDITDDVIYEKEDISVARDSVDLDAIKKYLFETALEEMGKIRSAHDPSEQRELRVLFSHATEHFNLMRRNSAQQNNVDLLNVDESFYWSRDRENKLENDVAKEQKSAVIKKEFRLARFNRLLLERLFPTVFLRTRRVSTPVLAVQDQTTRCYLFIFTSLVFSILFMVLPVNGLSPVHNFYRKKISNEFLQSSHSEKNKPYRMHELKKTMELGGAIQLFVADLRLSVSLPINRDFENSKRNEKKDAGEQEKRVEKTVEDKENIPQIKRDHHPYVYSPFHIGSPAIGYQKTKTEENDDVGLDDAVTISGAAVNPSASATGSLRWILAAINLRLGEWIFCGDKKKESWFRKLVGPTPRHIFAEWSREWVNRDDIKSNQSQSRQNDNKRDWKECWTVGSISDGGFIDFLGIDELLRRRCKVIVVIDSSINTGECEFAVLAEAIRRARLDRGCVILDIDDDKPLDIRRLERDEKGLAAQHVILGRIIYPDKDDMEYEKNQEEHTNTHHEGLLVYVQMTRTGDEEIDVTQQARSVKSFPDHPTSDQFFNEAMVEAYRSLGRHIGDAICAGLPDHTLIERSREEYQKIEEENLNYCKPEYLDVEQLTDALIESYRLDCREVRIDRRDDLRRLPMNSFDPLLNNRIKLPGIYTAQVRSLFMQSEFDGTCLIKRNEMNFSRRRLDEERFLRLYESDPNLRYRVRCFIHSFVHSDWKIYKNFKKLPDLNKSDKDGSKHQFSAFVVACHDFCIIQGSDKNGSDRYISKDGDSLRVSDGRDLLVGEDRFQAGGRYELLSACVGVSKVIDMLADPKAQDNHQIVSLLVRSLTTISDAVFRYVGVETATLFNDFMNIYLSNCNREKLKLNEVEEDKKLEKQEEFHSDLIELNDIVYSIFDSLQFSNAGKLKHEKQMRFNTAIKSK